MIKLYYIKYIDPCKYKKKETTIKTPTMIGSTSCQKCINCFGWDSEENWVKCLKHSILLNKNI